MKDIIQDTLKSNNIVLWEEIARDGAQAKTLLSGSQRVKVARAMGDIFGPHGPKHVIFAAGYPAIHREEFEIIRQLVAEVDNCSLATHGRAIKADVDLGIAAMQGASYGRISYALPIAEKYSQIMLNQSLRQTIQHAIDLAHYALDKANGIPVDVALACGYHQSPALLADVATALTDVGIATVKICDSTGELFPLETHHLFKQIFNQIPENVFIGTHFHNDFGLALANNLETIRLGARLISTSWIGLGERTGLAATEQLLFALAQSPESLQKRLDIKENLWLTPPDLKQLRPIAEQVSEMLSIPLQVTNPIVSPDLYKIATGAYFKNPGAFRAFDPEEILGVSPQFTLTHLANRGMVKLIADELGYTLDQEQVQSAFEWVKKQAYQQNISMISHTEFAGFLAQLKGM